LAQTSKKGSFNRWMPQQTPVSDPRNFDVPIGSALRSRFLGLCCKTGYVHLQDTLAVYLATALHELAHWSGAKHRLDRQLSNRFGTQAYAAEELIAELGAAFLCAHLNIEGKLRHAEYIANWLELLREDPRAIFTAASKASQAADFLRSFSEVAEEAAYGACQWETIALAGFKAALAGTANLLPVGLAVVVTTIANGLLSSAMKDRLVFLRWHQAPLACSCIQPMRLVSPSTYRFTSSRF
jgi:hypothetical protein